MMLRTIKMTENIFALKDMLPEPTYKGWRLSSVATSIANKEGLEES
jgi:hypothetical protein